MTGVEKLVAIYHSEENFQIKTFWDGYFELHLGDETNGYKESHMIDMVSVDHVELIIDSMWKAAGSPTEIRPFEMR